MDPPASARPTHSQSTKASGMSRALRLEAKMKAENEKKLTVFNPPTLHSAHRASQRA